MSAEKVASERKASAKEVAEDNASREKDADPLFSQEEFHNYVLHVGRTVK